MAPEQIIEQIWTKFTSTTCKELVESMPRRLERCVLVFGGSMNKYLQTLYDFLIFIISEPIILNRENMQFFV